jgi:hypothetical protein
MENIIIIFYNLLHVGDTHFAQPFVKNIIKNNPNNEFYIFHDYNTFSYLNEISSIKDINLYENIKSKIINILNINLKRTIFNPLEIKSIHEFLPEGCYYTKIYDPFSKILIINTWVGTFAKMEEIVECNLITYNNYYTNTINEINNIYNLNIVYDNSINLDLFPCISNLEIDSFNNIKNNTNKKIVFYYNYLARSGQSFPIKNEDEHNYIIKYLSTLYIIVVPYKSSTLYEYINQTNCTSILFAEDLINIDEFYTCKNLYYYAQMANDSDIAIYFDNGRSFLYANKNFILNNNNLKIHFSNTEKFYKNINDERLVPKNYINYFHINIFTDIINYFENYINI